MLIWKTWTVYGLLCSRLAANLSESNTGLFPVKDVNKNSHKSCSKLGKKETCLRCALKGVFFFPKNLPDVTVNKRAGVK